MVVNGNGNSYVGKAQLSVSLKDVVRTYGNATITSGGYGVSGITGLVNGDSYSAGDVKVTVTGDGALTGNPEGKVTNDYGNYTWSGDLTTDNAALKNNYKLELKEDGVSKVGKAKLNVGLSDVYRTYGNATITSGGYSAGNIIGLVNGDSYNANDFKVTVNSDGAIAGVTGDRVTNDHGDYTWSGTVEVANAGLNKNYDLVVNGNGNSYVGKAQLSVSLNDVVRTYGNATITSGGYSAGNITGLVNGDNYDASDFKVTVNSDGAIAGVTGDRATNDHGEYTWNGTIEAANAGLNTNYDLVVNANGKSYVDKATLNVSLNDVVRTYGNATITSGGYSASNITGLVNGDSYNAGDVKVTVTGDDAIAGVSGNRVTNDAGKYEWTGSASTTNEGLGKNYNLVVNGNGKSTVKKANLVVNLNDITRVYGNLDAKDYSKAFTFGENAGLVNGDSGLVINADKDGAITEGSVSDVKKTNNVGSYEWNGTASGVDNLNTNYDVTVNAGKSDVTPAKLTFVVDDKTITQGVPAEYTGKANGLTNGDTLAGIGVGGYELDSSVNPLIVGVYEDKIGVLINGSLHLTGGYGLLKNYKVEIDPGTLTVLASFNPADDYWFGTAPWDKERNLRERKAEFHYVAGGMSL